MPVRPVSVSSSAFGELPGIAFDETIRQVLAVQHVLGEEMILVVHQVFATDHHVQHARCIRSLVAAFTFGTLVDGLVPAEHVHQFVEKRNVGHRPGIALSAQQCLVCACLA